MLKYSRALDQLLPETPVPSMSPTTSSYQDKGKQKAVTNSLSVQSSKHKCGSKSESEEEAKEEEEEENELVKEDEVGQMVGDPEYAHTLSPQEEAEKGPVKWTHAAKTQKKATPAATTRGHLKPTSVIRASSVSQPVIHHADLTNTELLSIEMAAHIAQTYLEMTYHKYVLSVPPICTLLIIL